MSSADDPTVEPHEEAPFFTGDMSVGRVGVRVEARVLFDECAARAADVAVVRGRRRPLGEPAAHGERGCEQRDDGERKPHHAVAM